MGTSLPAFTSTVYRFSDPDLWPKMITDAGGIPFAGVYRLHRLDNDNHPVPMPRLLDIDQEGILYLGTSLHVPNRVTFMRRAMLAAYKALVPETYSHHTHIDYGAHQTGKKLIRIGRRFPDLIPYGELGVTIVRYVTEKPVQEGEPDWGHFAQEEELLRAYEAIYGERPALNG